MKLTNIFLLTAAVGALASCDDLFEPALDLTLDISEMETDNTFARGILESAFILLPYQNNPVNSTDMVTDDAVINELGNNWKKMATGGWTTSMDPTSQWNDRYHAIQYCNLFLENESRTLWSYKSPVLNQMFSDNYRGNAYALRAIQLFYLLRNHAGPVGGEMMGVPIHTEAEDGGSDFNKARNTFAECIEQIMKDLDKAMEYLPQAYGDAGTLQQVLPRYRDNEANISYYNTAFGNHHRGRIDGNIIDAVRAQVMLFAASPAYAKATDKSWTEAAEAAAKSLDNIHGLAGMSPTGWYWFDNTKEIDNLGVTDTPPVEIVWRTNIEKNHNLESDNYPPTLEGNGRVNPTQNLVDAFPMANGYPIDHPKSGYDPANPYEGRDPRLSRYILVNKGTQGKNDAEIGTATDAGTNDAIDAINGRSTTTGYYLRKLLRSDVNLNPAADETHYGARIRYTEIFLDYAEAANEAQDAKATFGVATYSAYDVIKALRQRAGIGVDGNDPYLDECAADKNKMRELIRNERRLELCFENHRFYDLRRWGLSNNNAAMGVKITAGKYNYFEVEPRKFEGYMNFGPLPLSEVMKFDNLKQNDGWK